MGLSWAYGAGHAPYWGPPTSTHNFCEEDYYATPYIGELINTFTNAAYIIVAALHYRHAPGTALGLVFLGLASGAFHASLRQGAMLTDETSMHVATGFVLTRLLYISHPRFARLVPLVVAAISAMNLYTMLYTASASDLLSHDAAFASMVVLTCWRCHRLVKGAGEGVGRILRPRMWAGAAAFVGGHWLWLLEVHGKGVCSGLRSARHSVGLPWGAVTELHGWWHILTAVGVHYYCGIVRDLENTYAELTVVEKMREGRKKA